MATQEQCSIGVVAESTYGTGVTVTRFLEFISESFNDDPTIVQGSGLRADAGLARSDRRVKTAISASGDFEMEAISKGMGLLFSWALGSGTSTIVTADENTYQQLFKLGDTPSSFTLQKGIPRVDSSTVDAYTFLGCMINQLEFTFANGEILTSKFTIDAREVVTATSYATPSYASSASLFHFAGASVYSGTLTEPTTTVLASATSEMLNVRSGSISLNNNLIKRGNAGSSGKKSKPVIGHRELTGSLEVEYDSTTLRDAFLNQTEMALLVQFETATTLDTGVETLQIVIPAIKLDGDLPTANGGDLITQSINFTGLKNSSATEDFYVVLRTADTAL